MGSVVCVLLLFSWSSWTAVLPVPAVSLSFDESVTERKTIKRECAAHAIRKHGEYLDKNECIELNHYTQTIHIILWIWTDIVISIEDTSPKCPKAVYTVY